MRYSLTFAQLLLALLLLSASQFSYAHQMRVFAFVEGKEVMGEVYFVGGRKAVNTPVELLRENTVFSEVVSDAKGNFVFNNIEANTYQIKADDGQGHLATFNIDISEFPLSRLDSKLSRDSNSVMIQATAENNSTCNLQSQAELQKTITHAIRPLRNQIEQYEAKTRFRDIVGGIGFIFGFFGVYVLVSKRRDS